MSLKFLGFTSVKHEKVTFWQCILPDVTFLNSFKLIAANRGFSIDIQVSRLAIVSSVTALGPIQVEN